MGTERWAERPVSFAAALVGGIEAVADEVQEDGFASALLWIASTHVGTGHGSHFGDGIVGQINRRMRLATLPKSLAFSDMSRM